MVRVEADGAKHSIDLLLVTGIEEQIELQPALD